MRWLVAVFAIALAVRGITLWEVSGVDPYFATPVVDELTNYQEAIRIAGGERMTAPFWKPPLYPHLLALPQISDVQSASAIYQDLPSPWIPKGLQALLDAVTAALLTALGTRLVGPRTGRIAGLLYAFSFTPVYFVAQVLDTTLFTFLCVAALLLLDKAREKNDMSGWALGGVVLGLAATARAPALLFAPVAVLLPWLHARRPSKPEATREANATDLDPTPSWRPIALRMSAVTAGVVLAILPVTLANWKFGGDTVLISSNGGINFYIGNREGDEPGADGLTSVNAGPRWRAILEEVDQSLPPSARSREYYRLTGAQISDHFGPFLGRLLRKSVALFDAFEVPNNKNFVEERSRSWAYTLLPGRTGLVLALGMVGLMFTGARLRNRPLIVGFLITQIVGIVLFFVAARYRVPVLAVLTIPAAAYLDGVLFERRRFPRLTASLIVLGLWIVLTHIDVLGLQRRFAGYVVDPLALAYARDHLSREALSSAASIRESDSDRAERLTQAAIRHFEASTRLYARALELDPDYPEVHHNLAIRALEAGDLDEAERRCRRALATSSDFFAEGWNTLGRILSGRRTPKSLAEGKKAFERAIDIDPTYSKAYANLGQIYESRFDTGYARANYELARRYSPDDPLYVILEARVLGKMNQPVQALAILNKIEERGLTVSPQHRELLEDVRAALIDAKRQLDEHLKDPSNTGEGPPEVKPTDG